MKRFIFDVFMVLMIVSIVSVVSQDVQQPTLSIDEQLAIFEEDIENGLIYEPNHEIYLLQTEENNAGKLGNALSQFVVKVVEEGVNFVKEIWISFS